MDSELNEPQSQRPGREQPHYLPTPAEIRAACREIQAGWDPIEELSRRVVNNPPARFPGIEGSAHVLSD